MRPMRCSTASRVSYIRQGVLAESRRTNEYSYPTRGPPLGEGTGECEYELDAFNKRDGGGKNTDLENGVTICALIFKHELITTHVKGITPHAYAIISVKVSVYPIYKFTPRVGTRMTPRHRVRICATLSRSLRS